MLVQKIINVIFINTNRKNCNNDIITSLILIVSMHGKKMEMF